MGIFLMLFNDIKFTIDTGQKTWLDLEFHQEKDSTFIQERGTMVYMWIENSPHLLYLLVKAEYTQELVRAGLLNLTLS